MSKRRLAFRQCDVARALRAAKAVGAARVVVRQDGAIEIDLDGEAQMREPGGPPLGGKAREIVL